MKKIAIMQPYFFPYIGYFQLINAVDEFVVYDNIEFSKNGWVHRNRILQNGKDIFITLPLRKDSDFLFIDQRFLADVWPEQRTKMLNRIAAAYRKAPYFSHVLPLFEKCIFFSDLNLFRFLLHSLEETKKFLEIPTPIIVSSTLPINHHLRSQEKVIALCRCQGATEYINPIGGLDLYEKSKFLDFEISLKFLAADEINYPQFGVSFLPFLSIIDVMMFNSVKQVREFLFCYTLR